MQPDNEPSWYERLARLVDAPEHPDRLDTERSRILLSILPAGALVSAAMFVFVPLWRDNPGPFIIGYGLTFLLHVVHIQIVRSGRPLFAARSFSVLFFVLVTVMVYTYGGIRGLGVFVYPLVVLFTGLTWSGTAAAGMAIAASATALVMAFVESRGLLTLVEPMPSAGAAWAVITASVTMTAVMLFVALRVIRMSAEAALESERKRRTLETELARAQRMESLGKLAGGVAHDFNNMLTGIIGHAELLSLKAREDRELAGHANLIFDTGQRAAKLTRQLLMFSRKGDSSLQLASVNQLIRNVVAILESSIDRRITVETHLTDEPDMVGADPALLESALLNLAINARDALPEGGRIRFETDRVDSPPTRISAQSDAYLRVRVSDTGAGIAPDNLERIFEPYFTTKETGKGTGLGLSAVYGTVRDLGGTIDVGSDVGKLTTFTLVLPVAAMTEEESSASPECVRDIGGGPSCVLAIDDEASVLDLHRGVLESFGHRVLTAHDVHDGLALFERRMEEIDLVILDLVMPKMSGRHLLDRIRARHETLPVVLTSGYTDESLDELLSRRNVWFLQKPYRRSDLAAIISEITA